MIVPQFWAEARRQSRRRDRAGHDRQVTVRRFGWSDDSQQLAQEMADHRADEALARITSGEQLPRFEPKVAYNGAHGVPIREEIVCRYGPSIITRNAYGARCLNTPDVLFADIDLHSGPGLLSSVAISALLSIAVVGLGWSWMNWVAGVTAVIVSLFVGVWLAGVFHKVREQLGGSAEAAALSRLKRFLNRHPTWHVRTYRTPAGLRVMALHRIFRPDEPEVTQFFDAVGTDPIYVRMCRNQNCFRARLSGKPWRIGIDSRMRPRPGVWPVQEERREERHRWIESYEIAARGFAACRLLDETGSGQVDPRVREVLELHDRESQARTSLPLA